MFRGEFLHSLDQKGRMIVPTKFSEALGEKFILTKGLDKCLFVFGMKEWQEFEEKVKKLPIVDDGVRRFVRFFLAERMKQKQINKDVHLYPHICVNMLV